MPSADEVSHLDRDEVRNVGDLLAVRGERLRANAGDADPELPPIPEDRFDLRGLVIALDEARQAFDQRLAALVTGAAEQAVLQVLETGRADAGHEFIHLPRLAR